MVTRTTTRTATTTSVYNRYIASPRWAVKRVQFFARYGRECFGCSRRGAEMHVHHLTYARFGHENLTDLVALCPDCHEAVHVAQDATKGTARTVLAATTRRVLTALRDYHGLPERELHTPLPRAMSPVRARQPSTKLVVRTAACVACGAARGNPCSVRGTKDAKPVHEVRRQEAIRLLQDRVDIERSSRGKAPVPRFAAPAGPPRVWMAMYDGCCAVCPHAIVAGVSEITRDQFGEYVHVTCV